AEEFIMALEGVGPSAIAAHEKVAAVVDKLAGKAIATRRADVEAILAGRPDTSSRPPPAPRARNLTLIGTGPEAFEKAVEAAAARAVRAETATLGARAEASKDSAIDAAMTDAPAPALGASGL